MSDDSAVAMDRTEWHPIGASEAGGAWTILFARFHEGAWEFREDQIGNAHIGGINNARSTRQPIQEETDD